MPLAFTSPWTSSALYASVHLFSPSYLAACTVLIFSSLILYPLAVTVSFLHIWSVLNWQVPISLLLFFCGLLNCCSVFNKFVIVGNSSCWNISTYWLMVKLGSPKLILVLMLPETLALCHFPTLPTMILMMNTFQASYSLPLGKYLLSLYFSPSYCFAIFSI